MDTICFPEPEVEDPTPASDDETRGQFLRRSTWTRAAAMRDFYNRNLGELPASIAERLCRDLHSDRTVAKHFELVVGRFLQVLGAARVEYEVPLSDGHRVDWRAIFPDGAVSVEATLPVTDALIGDAMKARRAVVNMIVRQAPRGWWVMIHHVPAIGPNESIQRLRRLVASAFAEAPTPSHEQRWSFEARYNDDRISVDLVGRPDPEAPGAWGAGPAVAGMDNTAEVLQAAIEGKRRQVRNAPGPVLLAMSANGFGSHDVEHFDRAVFGDEVWNVDSGATRFRANGALRPTPAGKEPTIAGVLAFAGLGMVGGPDPILYLHPRFTGTLPAAIRGLRQRVVSERGVDDVDATAEGRLMTLGWPTGLDE